MKQNIKHTQRSKNREQFDVLTREDFANFYDIADNKAKPLFYIMKTYHFLIYR